MIRAITLFFLITIQPLVLADSAKIPAAPHFDVASYVLIDATTGEVLAAQQEHRQIMPASTTKIMTAYIVDQAIANGQISKDQLVPISRKAADIDGTRMLNGVHTEVPVEVLYQGMVIQSGNDASIALAEFIAGDTDNFSVLMNQEAARSGMRNTHFVNPNGLPDPGHYSSAYDMAILTRALINEFPESYEYYSQKSFTYKGYTKDNTNLLLKNDPTVDGVKTGYTIAAKHCLVSSAKRGDMRLIAVVMGAKSSPARNKQSQELLDYGFRYYETVKIYEANETVVELPLTNGKKKQLAVGLAEDLWVTIPRGEYDDLLATVDVPDIIQAPVTKDQQEGLLILTLNNKDIAEKPIYALESVEEASWWQKLFSGD